MRWEYWAIGFGGLMIMLALNLELSKWLDRRRAKRDDES